MTDNVYTLAQIREVFNDGLPHCAKSELKRWMEQNEITAEVAELEADIENTIKAAADEWEEFLETLEEE